MLESADPARIHARFQYPVVPPETRMRMTVVRQTVGTDHRDRVGHHPLQILLVDLEIDGARRLQPLNRLVDVAAPLGGDLVEHASRALRCRL